MTDKMNWKGVMVFSVTFITVSNLQLLRTFVIRELYSKIEIENEIMAKFPSIEKILLIEKICEALCPIDI